MINSATTRSAMAGLSATSGDICILTEPGREGTFVFDGSNLSARVTADTYQGIYVAPTSHTDGSSGAWVRKYDGDAQFSWFGIVTGGTSNAAARAQSAINLLADATIGATIRLPRGQVVFDGAITVLNGVVIKGHGNTAENPGTFLEFPARSSGFICDYQAGLNDAWDTKICDLRIYQPTASTTTATVNYTAATRTVSIQSGTNDYSNRQLVWIEGAGLSYVVQGRTYASSNGSATLTIQSLGGNPGVHPGQYISGSGIPAGTTVVSMTSNTITLSANATATLSGQSYTVIYPLIARVITGGGTSSLVLDHVLDHHNATGVVMRHADAAIDSMRPVQLENVDAVGFPVGIFLGADSSGVPPSITNTTQIRFCRLSSSFASLVFTGSDANACGIYGCDFSFSDKYAVLDLSLIGNKYFGCHFAFNVGIACPKATSTSALFGCYFESGTSYLGNADGCTAFGCDEVRNGNGWAAVAESGAGFQMPSMVIETTQGSITAPEGYFTSKFHAKGSFVARFENNVNGTPAAGSAGVGIEFGMDAGQGESYVTSYNRSTSAFASLVLRGSTMQFWPENNLVGMFNATGLNLTSGNSYKINNNQVVGARQAAIGAPTGGTTIDAEARTAIGSILTVLRTHGLIAT